MAQDWSVHALVYFYSARSDLPWAVLNWRLDMESTDMKTIIEMAREAGDDWDSTLSTDKEFLKRFAALVAAAEREACAKVCDEARAARLAEVIRARGQA
jgi:hypothetical protein